MSIQLSQDLGRTKNIIVRAGIGAGANLANAGSSQYLINAGQYIVKYKGPAAKAEVVYLTFPTPITVDFIILQWQNINHNVQLAELRVIKCMSSELKQDGAFLESSSYLNVTLRYLGPWDPWTFGPWDLLTLGLWDLRCQMAMVLFEF